MKYCPVEGHRYPDSVAHCKACGAALVAGEGFAPPGGATFHTLCCPKPACPMVVALPQAKFCDQCGGGLVPISLDAWMGKFVVPALESKPFEFTLDHSGALRRAGEMGLSREAVEVRLEQALIEKIGVSPAAFVEWVREVAKILQAGAGELEEARRLALKSASARGISAAFAAPVVGRLAAKIEAQREPAEGGERPPTPTRPEAARAGQSGAASGRKETRDGNASPDAAATTARTVGRPDARAGERTRPDGPERAVAVTDPKDTPEDVGGGWEARARTAAVIFALGFILLVAGVLLYHFVRGRQAAPTDAGTNANEISAPGEPSKSEQGNVPEAGSSNGNTAPTVEPSPEATLTANANANANAEAEPEEVATVMLLPNVDGVEVWIDNVSGGVASRTRPRSVRLSPGQHVIRATKPNYEVWERPLTLSSKQRLTVSVLMEEMSGEPVVVVTPPTTPSPREVARAHAENARRLFEGGSIDEALAEVNQGLRASNDDPTLLSLKQRLERTKSVLQSGSKVPADTLGPSQRRIDQQEARADRGAQLVRMPNPVYPPASISKGSTTVWVEVQVDERGGVSSARAVSGPSSFHGAAVSAARQAVFRPAMRNGQAAGDRVRLAVMFNPQ